MRGQSRARYAGTADPRAATDTTGFVSASHFSTCYRQLYGKTRRAERAAIA